MSEFSDYIVFVDESGSPSLAPIDPNHPVFVLVFCVINKWTYCDMIQPAIKRLKFEFFGHDMVVLHSADIRKRRGEFSVLMQEGMRKTFLTRLDEIVEAADVNVIATVIDKTDQNHPSVGQSNPYHLALARNILLLNEFLLKNEQQNRGTHIIAESRGRSEDGDLREAFDRSVASFNVNDNLFSKTPFTLRFADKKINSAGLQLADLFAHPIGRHCIDPSQKNHAFEIIRRKIFNEILRYP